MASPKTKGAPEPYRAPGAHGVALAAGWLAACQPRERPPLSKFMVEHARSDDGARIRPFPFQADIADAFTDPETAQLSVRKSSRIGYSTILQCFVAWRITFDPARTLIYQPTIDDAEKFSRDDLDPVLQWPVVRSVATFKPRHADNQIRAKRYKGGWIQIKGANSPKEFRRVTADDVFLEECDGYPWASKEEGDPARLAFKRNLTSPRRFSAAGSTPKVKGFSRIDQLFEQGSQEYRYVPCPKCGHMQTLVFGDGTGPGIRWAPKEIPTRAWYQCEQGCEIDEAEKPWMDENGEWRAANPAQFPRHRSFHIWAAYSQHPGAAWLEIAREFMEVRKDPNLLSVVVIQAEGRSNPQKSAIYGALRRPFFRPRHSPALPQETTEIRPFRHPPGGYIAHGVAHGLHTAAGSCRPALWSEGHRRSPPNDREAGLSPARQGLASDLQGGRDRVRSSIDAGEALRRAGGGGATWRRPVRAVLPTIPRRLMLRAAMIERRGASWASGTGLIAIGMIDRDLTMHATQGEAEEATLALADASDLMAVRT